MKKYIAPVAKNINLQAEGSLMTLSNEVNNNPSTNPIDASNRRNASSSIWDYED